MSGSTQTSPDPIESELHKVFSRIFTETDGYFATLRGQNRGRFRTQDIISAPAVVEICSDAEIVQRAIQSFKGFFISQGFVKQHFSQLPKVALQLQGLPPTCVQNDVFAIFEKATAIDGGVCPLPIRDKIRADSTNSVWLAVFASEDDARKAQAAIRGLLVDGCRIVAYLKNEQSKLSSYPQSAASPARPDHVHQQGMLFPGPGTLAPQFSHLYSHQMLSSPVYYPHPGPGYMFTQVPPGYTMPHYAVPQTPMFYPPAYPQMYSYDANMHYAGAPTPYFNNMPSPQQPNQMNSGGNKQRRQGQNQSRSGQYRNRDQVTGRYPKADGELSSPTGASVDLSEGQQLDSTASIPAAFSNDANEADVTAVPTVSIPVAAAVDGVVPQSTTTQTELQAGNELDNSVAAEAVDHATPLVDMIAAPPTEVSLNAKTDGEVTPIAVSGAKKDGNKGTSNTRDSRGNNKNSDRKGKNDKNSKDNAGSNDKRREKKTPPVNLSLEKDFPTLNIGEAAKTSPAAKSSTPNYANALKRPTDSALSPTNASATSVQTKAKAFPENQQQIHQATASAAHPVASAAGAKKESSEGAKVVAGTSVNGKVVVPAADVSTVASKAPVASGTAVTSVPELTAAATATSTAVSATTGVSNATLSSNVAASSEPANTTAASSVTAADHAAPDQTASSGKKTFIDAVRARK